MLTVILFDFSVLCFKWLICLLNKSYVFLYFLKTNYTKAKGLALVVWERHAINYSTSNSRMYLCVWRSEDTSGQTQGIVLGSRHPWPSPNSRILSFGSPCTLIMLFDTLSYETCFFFTPITHPQSFCCFCKTTVVQFCFLAKN